MIRSWSLSHGHTAVSIDMAPRGSYFIVFRKPAKPPVGHKGTFSQPGPIESWESKSIRGPWTIRFDTASGVRAAPVIFGSLQDWSLHTDSAIRYYSGTAIYTTSFQMDAPATAVALALGRVANIATVSINGIDCGTAWTPPYQVDITKAVRKGTNELRISVTNTWANRLTGDQRLPEGKRRTWTTAPLHPDGTLLPAGLLGPVRIINHALPAKN